MPSQSKMLKLTLAGGLQFAQGKVGFLAKQAAHELKDSAWKHIDALLVDNAKLQMEIVQLESALSASAVEKDELKEENEKSTGKIEMLEYKNLEVAEKLAEMESALNAKTTELNATTAAYDGLKEQNAELNEKTAALKEQNAELNEKTAALKKENAELTEKTAELKKENEDLNATTAELTEENDGLKDQNAELTKKIEEIERKLEKEIAPLTQRIKSSYFKSKSAITKVSAAAQFAARNPMGWYQATTLNRGLTGSGWIFTRQ